LDKNFGFLLPDINVTGAKMNDNTSVTRQTTKPPAGRILGTHPQKQIGFFMQRIKILGGRINWPQWRKIAELAELYSPGTPLHITTRQDIELHNISEADLALVHQDLTSVGLSLFAAGGDSIRNLTVSTGCELCESSPDLMPLAEMVRRFLEQQSIVFQLPRKFKISFSSCCHTSAKPWLNDLGFIASADGTFTVIGAGSLGPKPKTGIKLYDNLPVKDILPLCLAAVEIFHDHGDRKNRHKARLRHVREKFGDAAFCRQLNRYFARIRDSRQWPDLLLGPEDKKIKLLYRLQFPNGNVSAQQAFQLADAAQPQKAQLRINLEHGLEIYGEKPVSIPEDVAALAENPVVVACPGSSTCPKALANGWDAADKIRLALTAVRHNGIRINISGCPNNCAQSAAADIGLIGVIREINGKSVEHYQVLIGGGNGKDNRLAQPYGVFPADRIADVVKKIVIEGIVQQSPKVLTEAQ
jgi:sulfite reductase (ferredoxin)